MLLSMFAHTSVFLFKNVQAKCPNNRIIILLTLSSEHKLLHEYKIISCPPLRFKNTC